MLTAGSFLGDAGWANRGENPAVLGFVGIAMRNAADSLFEKDPDWYEIEGQLTEAATGGEFYFSPSHFDAVSELVMSDDGILFEPGAEGAADVPASWVPAQGALRGLAAEVADVADRVRSDGISSDALSRASDSLAEAAGFFDADASATAAAVAAANSAAARVEAELARAGEGREAALERLALQYQPDMNPGREFMVLPAYRYILKLIEEQGSGGAGSSPDSPQASAAALVEAELAGASDGRRAVLKRLALQYHPDQNLGREDEVLPVFLYVQRLRDAEDATQS